MASILAIESDSRQATLLKCLVRNHVGASLVVASSTRDAIAAIDADAPDLVLLSALLSPRDEEEAIAHLRGLNRADHLQTLTIPRFASTYEEDGRRGGLLGAFTRRRVSKQTAGCDPKQFAEQIAGYLQRAEDIKAERAAMEEAANAEAARIATPQPSVAAQPVLADAPVAAPVLVASPGGGVPAPGADGRVVVDQIRTPLPRPAPRAPRPMPGVPAEPTLAPVRATRAVDDDLRELINSLRVPRELAEIGVACGCRIRHVTIIPPPLARQSARVHIAAAS